MRNARLGGGYATEEWEVEELAKIALSFPYFCAKYVKIRTAASTEDEGFYLHPYQVLCADAFMNKKYVISVKPRQMGLSTLLQAFLLWECITQGNREIAVVTIKHTVAKNFLWRIKNMYAQLPNFIRTRVRNGNTRDIGSATEIKFSNGSNITVMGSTQDAGRSNTLTRLVIDEAAFQRYAEDMWGAASPTLTIKGQAIIISTAYGFGNFFEKEWTKAEKGIAGSMYPIRLHYTMWPGRDEAWLKEQIAVMGHKRVEQEILCNFLKSGDSVFSMENIREIEDRLAENPPKRIIDLYGQPGSMLVYEEPMPGHIYFIGVDIATGRSADFTAFSVYRKNLDIYNMPEVRVIEVACGKVKCNVIEAADMIASIGQQFNMALIAVERNGAGEGTVARLQDIGYPNIYHHTSVVYDPKLNKRAKQSMPGFTTTAHIRKVMVGEMDADIGRNEVIINNPFFVKQAYTFVYGSDDTPVAVNKRGRHTATMYEDESSDDRIDDSILAACITNYISKRRDVGGLPILPIGKVAA